MSRLFPIGISDFRKLREADLEYIDKSHFVQGLLDDRGGPELRGSRRATS